MCAELIGYLENNDAKGIKSMLSEKTRSSPSTDMQIAAALELFDGKVTSSPVAGMETATAAELYDGKPISLIDNNVFEGRMNGYIEGKTRYLVTTTGVSSIITDKNKTYSIWLHAQFSNDRLSDSTGVYLIEIFDNSGHECVIGEQLEIYKQYEDED